MALGTGVPMAVMSKLRDQSMVNGSLSMVKLATNIANWKAQQTAPKATVRGTAARTPTRPAARKPTAAYKPPRRARGRR